MWMGHWASTGTKAERDFQQAGTSKTAGGRAKRASACRCSLQAIAARSRQGRGMSCSLHGGQGSVNAGRLRCSRRKACKQSSGSEWQWQAEFCRSRDMSGQGSAGALMTGRNRSAGGGWQATRNTASPATQAEECWCVPQFRRWRLA